MSDCVFCKIAEGEIPSRKIYEDEHVVAFLDLSQVTPGHTLVIPKKHVPNIMEYNETLAADVFSRLPKISQAVQSFQPDIKGLNVLMNNGEVASQTVFHSHIHLLPRYTKDDDFGLKWADNSEKYTDNDLDRIQQDIKQALEGQRS